MILNPRDAHGNKTDQIKSQWRKATHSRKDEVSATETKARARRVPREGTPSLKEFSRRQGTESATRWFHNKRAR